MEDICLPSESKDHKLSKMYFFITVSLKMAELEEIEVETKVQIFSWSAFFNASLRGPSKDYLLNQGIKSCQFISIHQEGNKSNQQA